MSERLPEKIGPYRVDGRLGRGGMGEVLSGYDERLDRAVALKRVHRYGDDPEKARERFRREARAAAGLSHSAIVQVHDWVEVGDDDWLVMELVRGLSLRELLEYDPPSAWKALRIAREIASGLAAAHDAGLIHRDLKASNLMIVENSEAVKILDFGIAKKITEDADAATLTREGGLVGTVTTMSPEQAMGLSLDGRSDLFSLGVVLYEMLGGENPFVRENAVETLGSICSWPHPPLRGLDESIPEDVSHFVDLLLSKDPKHRPADGHEVVRRIDRLIDAEYSQGIRSAPRIAADETTLLDPSPFVGAERSVVRSAAPVALAALLVGAVFFGRSLLKTPAEKPSASQQVAAAETQSLDTESLDKVGLTQRGLQRLERYDRDGQIEAAIVDFQRALTLDEHFAPALAGLARAYWLDSRNQNRDPARLEQAEAAATRAVAIDEFLASARVALGMIRLETDDVETAEQELQKALELNPLDALVFYGLGKAAEARSDRDLAEENYRRAAEIDPENWLPRSALGILKFRAGRYEEAEGEFLESLEKAPDNYLLLRNLGGLYYMQNRLDEAASRLQQALQIRPDHSAYANLGNIYFIQGLYPQAVAAFEKAIETGGANFYYMWANLGDAYRWVPDQEDAARSAYRRAIELLNEKIDPESDRPTPLTRLMLYRAKLGDCDAVPQNLDDAARIAREDASAWYRTATALEICGRRSVALPALEKALEAGYPATEAEKDPELMKLRQDADYHRLRMRQSPE